MTVIQPPIKAKVNLGWANGWPETPTIVKECHRAGHRPVEYNLDSTMHGYDTLVECEICGYSYHYDSSG